MAHMLRLDREHLERCMGQRGHVAPPNVAALPLLVLRRRSSSVCLVTLRHDEVAQAVRAHVLARCWVCSDRVLSFVCWRGHWVLAKLICCTSLWVTQAVVGTCLTAMCICGAHHCRNLALVIGKIHMQHRHLAQL